MFVVGVHIVKKTDYLFRKEEYICHTIIRLSRQNRSSSLSICHSVSLIVFLLVELMLLSLKAPFVCLTFFCFGRHDVNFTSDHLYISPSLHEGAHYLRGSEQ
jgi:hypothetical protein